MGKLEGKRVVVTGAAAGLGAVVAEHFAGEGADIFIADMKPADGTVEAVRGLKRRGAYATCDVTDETAVANMADQALEFFRGGIDVLVNNAGMNGFYQPVKDARIGDWQQTMQVNFFGTVIVTRAFIPTMIQQRRGTILITASNVGKRGLPIRGDYVCSKWALRGFTQTLALELAEHGIRVNAVCPGPIEGDRIEDVMERHCEVEGIPKSQIREAWAAAAPMGRFVEPQEVAAIEAFLCSDESTAMTGQSLNATGGFLMD
jgi:NAD(P)-dependent dehydrogenase (short-subunit alcohol dehydrogenase family)